MLAQQQRELLTLRALIFSGLSGYAGKQAADISAKAADDLLGVLFPERGSDHKEQEAVAKRLTDQIFAAWGMGHMVTDQEPPPAPEPDKVRRERLWDRMRRLGRPEQKDDEEA